MGDDITIYDKHLKIQRELSPSLFLVEEEKSHLKFTVKCIKNPSPQYSSFLHNEISLLSTNTLSHPNIISLYLSEESQNSTTLLYEYCTNGSLLTYTHVQPLKIFYQICLGINYLHSISIVHKNLNLSNILISEGIAKISGFEIASQEELLLDAESENSGDYLEVTNPLWRPPEMKRGGQTSKEVDIWGLGLILYYMLFKKNYDFDLPETLPQQYKDLFAMTLDLNPSKRANTSSLLKKIEEKTIREPINMAGCSCFCSKRILSSSKSTLSLVKKALSADFRSTKDDSLKRLVSKGWAKPEKIQKFFAELLRLPNLSNDLVRLKTYSILYSYLQQAPVIAYNNFPGVLEVVNYIESNACPFPFRERNDYFLRVTHLFGVITKLKFYMIKSYTSYFNGMFIASAETSAKLLQEPQVSLINELTQYWEIVMKLHEILFIRNQHEQLLRLVRVLLAEEQAHLLEFMHTQIETFQSVPSFQGISRRYFKNLQNAKKLFDMDQLAFPVVNFQYWSQNVLEENNRLESMRFVSIPQSKRRFSSQFSGGRFTPVDLDQVDLRIPERKNNLPVEPQAPLSDRPPTVYATANKDSSLLDAYNQLVPPQEEAAELSRNLRDQLSSWKIASTELTFIKQIGNGSSCEVWLGLYQRTEVAIKKQKSKEPRALKEFYRELSVLINLRHPNLVIFMGACFEEPVSIVTEYCAGGDLFNLLHKKKNVFISWQQKLKILQEIAKGMIFLHSNNYIHRDLKSLNILLSSEVNLPNDNIQLKISDFGLSRMLSDDSFMTGQLGTCHWMAPEVLNSSSYTNKADVYSFGIVMYEVITRETPYRGKTHEEIRTQILLHRLRPDLSIIPPNCPVVLRSLMVLCWDQDCRKRPCFSNILDILNSISISNS